MGAFAEFLMTGTAIYRAQTIGSMLRPASLRDARHALRQGTISSAAFKRIEDHAVDDALAIQERAGIDLVTDGEQRRASFLGSLLEKLPRALPATLVSRNHGTRMTSE
jgi:methionine synthase II (cobalamin-independent)